MRNAGLILSILAVLIAIATATPNIFSPFYEPILHNFFGTANNTQELRRRQDTSCPSGYGNNCAGLGNAALCCPDDSVCSADYAGNVACCPQGAACTGAITSDGSASTTTDGAVGGVVSTPATTTSTSTSTDSFVFASSVTTTTSSGATETVAGVSTGSGGGGVVVVPGSGASNLATVSNPYFPIAIIPATYTNAAACSSAYSSCQSDIAPCTAVLQGSSVGVGDTNGGITINAPNGGTTVVAATTSYPSETASSICASLSTRACGTFSVEMCSRFGGASGTAGGGGSVVSAGASGARYVGRAGPAVYIVMVAIVMV